MSEGGARELLRQEVKGEKRQDITENSQKSGISMDLKNSAQSQDRQKKERRKELG